MPRLFAGFPPLLLRQAVLFKGSRPSRKVFFGMAKFLVFDTVAAFIYRQFPWFARSIDTLSVCICDMLIMLYRSTCMHNSYMYAI